MTIYRARGVERRFPGHGDPVKVVVVEGARATGKTRLMQHLVEAGRLRTYADLSDPTVRTAAEADLEGWLASLPTPAVIDEAQLLPELPLAVKRIVDQRPQSLQFVLTGSSSIARSGLGGADPLAGRAERLVLRTFTDVERRGLQRTEPSVVDRLFEGRPQGGAHADPIDEAQLLERIERGGLPEFALGTGDRNRRSARIREDVLDALGRELDPTDRFDAMRVRDALDALVRAPGRIINAVKLGDAMGVDRRTVERYLAVLERRFLITRLPNLAMSPIGQAVSRAKVHPFDTAIAAESLRRAGVDLRADRERFGQMLESWVVQQITSAATWSRTEVEAYYWRRSQRPFSEVDLVLVDDRGRTVGIEVKAAGAVRAADADGLRAIRQARGLHRGFVVYLGTTVVALGDDIWAIPINLIDSKEGLQMNTADRSGDDGAGGQAAVPDAVDASLFLSYVHADDEYLGGAMLAFAEALQASYRFLYGRDIRIFTDRTDLAWGSAWQKQLDSAAQDTQFLLAMLTPSYLRSDACRREFEQFLAASANARDELVLAVRWTPLPPATGHDPVRAHLDAHQWQDAGDLTDLAPGTPAYRAAVGAIARRLHDVVEQRERPSKESSSRPADDERDLIDEMSRFEEIRPRFEEAADRFGVALGAVGERFAAAEPVGSLDTYASAAAFARLGDELSDPTAQLESANANLTEVWSDLDQVFARLLALVPALANQEQREELRRTVVGLRVSLDIPGIDEMEAMAAMLAAISRHLRPTARALQESLRVIRTMQHAADDWRAQL